METDVVLKTDIPGLPLHATGKVRDVYRVGNDALLLVATDRISAFDVVMNQGIPEKGRLLTALSVFWFHRTRHIVPNHLITADDAEILERLAAEGVTITDDLRQMLAGRAMLCRRTKPLPIEAVVRGYISGSAWKAYRTAPVIGGKVDLWGTDLPLGLHESDRLPEPIFTPSTKATAGHDEPMHRTEIGEYTGRYAAQVEQFALLLYRFAWEYAADRGILLADTKFEFGTLDDGTLLLIDEAMTPDSSRYWPADSYAPGGSQPSYDKQMVRDYLEAIPNWNKQPPPPDLSPEIIARTTEKYREAYRVLTE